MQAPAAARLATFAAAAAAGQLGSAAALPAPTPAASQVITRLLTFGLNLATARSLTPEAYGVRRGRRCTGAAAVGMRLALPAHRG